MTPLTRRAGLALDRFWVVHRLDLTAPDSLLIESPQGVVGVGQTLVTGSAHDQSGVTQVQVEVQMPGANNAALLPDAPALGRALGVPVGCDSHERRHSAGRRHTDHAACAGQRPLRPQRLEQRRRRWSSMPRRPR